MTASVQNRQFTRLDAPINGVVRSFNFSDLTRPKTTANFVENDDASFFSSSSDDDDDENDNPGGKYLDLIRKSNSELEPSILDPRDEATSDSWVPRNPSMVRLTGKHPFNCEAPLARLMHHGFITPVPLHYVRNHGAVPKGTWQDWTVEVTGLVRRPARFTMEQLVREFKSREFPVTLVCAGNRRKEQNMVKKTIGFNWGPAGISNSVWRGVPLCDVLKRCGIYGRKNGALNVCFEGAEDLPGGGGSKYGTSVKKEVADGPVRRDIISWHNRVLPSHVNAELANAEAWWYKPEYIINELNINSVITTPSHEEILPINSWTSQRPYTMKGYAYSGGGKKVTRVEVTMDGGDTWLVCTLDHQEKPNKYGKYWCWCFWSLEVEVLSLIVAKEIAVRAWDETQNTQPEKLIWNVMGMMNNCWFRVRSNVCKRHKGEIGIVFEHPTQPGNQSGGWMAKEKHLDSESNTTLKKSVSTPFMNTTSSKTYSLSKSRSITLLSPPGSSFTATSMTALASSMTILVALTASSSTPAQIVPKI
ncbi:nitrate reductase [Prunus yedoensis var. nudiflora]|uniref:Nitrate reductase n=1 Tax=Prunus yedoensis var. nudiflora TaxID=2094558 RepID=A0A314UHB3_PRUYE|nr:nitrate reductase [Prunus yedoensis var. nudiflora]